MHICIYLYGFFMKKFHCHLLNLNVCLDLWTGKLRILIPLYTHLLNWNICWIYMTENLRCLHLPIWTLGAYILDFVVFCSYKLRYFPFFFTQLRETNYSNWFLWALDTTKFTAYSLQTDVVLIWILSRQQLDN
jgi:hypothetical protein